MERYRVKIHIYAEISTIPRAPIPEHIAKGTVHGFALLSIHFSVSDITDEDLFLQKPPDLCAQLVNLDGSILPANEPPVPRILVSAPLV